MRNTAQATLGYSEAGLLVDIDQLDGRPCQTCHVGARGGCHQLQHPGVSCLIGQ
jgi:hypothetical protein